MDALSELLRSLRLKGAVFIDAELSAPWAIRTPSPRAIANVMMPEAQRVIPYHFIIEGECWVRLASEEAIALRAGEVALFPHGDVHDLFSAPGVAVNQITEEVLTHLLDRGKVTPVRFGGADSAVRLVCGFFACDERPSEQLVQSLPRLVHVQVTGDETAGAFPLLLKRAVADAAHRRIGTAAVLCKMSELLFVDAIRSYVETLPPDHAGWLSGLRDKHVSRALALIHAAPEHAWSLEELASRVGTSRSALVDRFTRFVGRSPIQYLLRWRLNLAANELRSSDRAIVRVAGDFGYDSEAAFSRAFRREFGVPPGAWRRATRDKANVAGDRTTK